MASKASSSIKRKVEDEFRCFQEKWTLQYLFVDFKSKPVCLICNETVAVMKEYNIKRHYETKHSSTYNSLQGHFRNDKVDQMKQKLHGQQSLFAKGTREAETSVRVSYIIAESMQNMENLLQMENL